MLPSLRHVTGVCALCSDRVQSLCYLQLTRQLVSCSSDGGIAVWNMDVSREEVRERASKAHGPGETLRRASPFSTCSLEMPVAGQAVPGPHCCAYWLLSEGVLCVTLHCILYSLGNFHSDRQHTQTA